MSFTAFTNVITILFCIAVLVQSVRMMRSLKQVRESQLDRTVGALDAATASARGVLAELKQTLSTDGAANARSLGEAKDVRDELNVMVGIANAMAERLVEAASAGSRQEAAADAPPAKKPAAPRTAKRAGAPAPKTRKTTKAKAEKAAPAAQKKTAVLPAAKDSTPTASVKPAAKRATAKPAARAESVPASAQRKAPKARANEKEMA